MKRDRGLHRRGARHLGAPEPIAQPALANGRGAAGAALDPPVPAAGHGTAARIPVMVVVAGLLIGAGLADRGWKPAPVPTEASVPVMPVAPPESALSSSWFCSGATGNPTNVADGTLVVANPTGQDRRGVATLIPNEGPPVTLPIHVGPFSRTSVPESTAGDVAFVGAVVDIDGGGVGVEQQIRGSQGTATAACATAGSDRWYFADGTTQENSSLLLTLLNPYPDDSIVDLSFVSEVGVETPSDFQGIVVPAHSVIGISVGDHLRRRARIATTVSARSGRVVAWKTQVINPPPASPPGAAPSQTTLAGTAPPAGPGLSLVLGAPSTGTKWWWPDGLVANGLAERFQIYNPGPAQAEVSLSVVLDQGSADPFQLRIAPQSTATVVTSSESRVPKGVGHAAILRSTNGVGVVAERTVDAGPPSARSGRLDLLGARQPAHRWLLASGQAGPKQDEWVMVYNDGPLSTNLSIVALAGSGLASINGLSGLTLPPGGRVALLVNQQASTLDQGLMVEASGNVVVERDIYPVKGTGLSASLGIPLGR